MSLKNPLKKSTQKSGIKKKFKFIRKSKWKSTFKKMKEKNLIKVSTKKPKFLLLIRDLVNKERKQLKKVYKN